MLAIAAGFKSQELSWFQLALEGVASSASSSDGGAAGASSADAATMRALQESFDATTRLTLATKRLGRDLISQGAASETIQSMIEKGVAMCAELVEPINTIERLLLTPPANVQRAQAMQALKDAAIPFEKLEVFYEELETLVKHHKKKQLAAGTDVH